MSPMTFVMVVLRKLVTNITAIRVPEMQGVPILNLYTRIQCQQFTSASTIHKNNLLPLCSIKKTAKVDLEDSMLPLNMVSLMTIMNHLMGNLWMAMVTEH